MRYLKIIFQIFVLTIVLQSNLFSQTCPAPSINAQAGTGPSTTICSGKCATLTATVVPVNSTTGYTVGSIPYAPFPFTGGVAAIGANDDVWSPAINIGFNFCFYGNNFNQVVVGSNGEMTFSTSIATLGESFTVNNILPNLAEHPGNTICGAYRDIDPSAGGTVMTYTTGVAPCRKFVAYWSTVPLFSCTNPMSTFQIVLHESSNIIEVNIQNSSACAAWQNGKGLIGIQNANGTTAVAPVGRNVLTPWTAVNESWQFVPTGAPTYTVNWSGPSGFSATGLTATPCPTATGNYTATMNLSNCAGGTITTFTSAVQVSVTPSPTVNLSASATTVCPSSSATLTASGATTYTWMPGSLSGSSVAVSPTTTTTYSVIGQTGSCTDTKTVQITVSSITVTASSSSPTVCSGSSVTLTGSGATTYTWNPGNIVGTTVAVSPTTNTTYTVTGATGACTGTATVGITVIASPVVSAFNLTGTICAGSTATLVGTGALTYTWNPGNIIGNIVNVTPTVSTTYTLSGTVGSCSGQATVNVNVNSGPTMTVAASSTSMCSSALSSVTLSASGAASYTWNPGAIISSSIVVNPTVTTNYSVTGANAAGCTATNTINILVTTTPTITVASTPTVLCSGNTATLSSSGATTYTWMPGSLSGVSVTVSPASTTIYTVTGANGSCTDTKTISLTVNASPTVTAVANPTSICSGASATLTGGGATSYTWMPGSISGATTVVNPASTTIYTLTGSNGSCSSSVAVTVSVNSAPVVTASANPSPLCRGTSATLTAGGATSYTWMPGSLTGAIVVVSPTVNTTYTVTGVTGVCTNSTTLFLVVVPVPTVNATANPTAICSGGSATLTGTGALTYTWMPGSITGNTIVVNPTITSTYTVTGTNGLGCKSTTTVTLTVNPNPTITAVANPTAICVGSTATLTSSGATSYTWMPGSLTGGTVTVSPTVTTNYTVTGTNGICSSSTAVTLSVTPLPTITAVSNPTTGIICAGNSATLTGSGATTYTWMPGSLIGTSVVVTPTANTIYTVTGANGSCTNTQTISLIINPGPTVTATSNPTTGIICAGRTATLSGSGAVTYIWMPGSMVSPNVVVNPTVTTTYTLTGSSGGCTNSVVITITVNPTPTISIAAVPSSSICSGQSATLTASGAIGTYSWLPGPVFVNPIVVSPTVTTVYLAAGLNSFGCRGTKTISINVTATPTLTAAASSPTLCSGNTVTLSSSGATTYTWMPGSLSGATVTASPTVTTTYTVTGANGACTGTKTINITVTPGPSITATASPTIICSGSSATLTSSGATTYTWMPGALIGSSVSVTPTITTTYTVTGANGFCTNTNSVIVTVNPGPTVTAVSSPTAICSGSSATLTANGATTYTWMPGSLSGNSVSVTPTITTTYTVTGNNGTCSKTTTVTLTVTTTPTVTAISNPTILCAGSSATLTANGATTYTWMPGFLIGNTVVVSPTVTTSYTVTGANGSCAATKTLNLVVNPSPTVIAVSNPTAMCAGSSATLTASGATTYTWMPGSLSGTTVVVTPTINTTYTVTGGSAGCTGTNTVSITIFSSPSVVAATSKTVICLGDTATLSATGAISYTWNPGGLTGTPVVVTPTTTTIYTVTGSNGICSSNATVSVVVNTFPVISTTLTPVNLCSGNTATMTASGATTYTWMPGALSGSSVTVSPTITTTYTITGANGNCASTTTVSLTVSPTPTVTASSTPTIVCAGVSATLTGNGATTYTWMPGALTGTSVVVTPTSTTVYTVTGNNGTCSSTGTVNLTVTPAPTLTAVSNPTTVCSGQTATLTTSGALSYTWMPVAVTGATIVVSPTVTTIYTVTGINAAGCTSTKTVNLTVNTTPTITASSSSTILCSGASVTLTAIGATSYSWNPGALTGTSVVVTPTANTTYTVVGANGSCTDTKTISITVNPSPTVTSAASPTILCSGSSSTLTANGALSYTWMPGSLSGATVAVTPTVITVYTVTGVNAFGCTGTSTVMVNVNTPTITAIASPTTICIGSSATITASGAISYTWMPGASTATSIVVNPTVTTTYTISGTSPLGCKGTNTITLNVVPIPTVTAVSSSTAVCAGKPATLTASGATTYTWMPGSLTGTSTVVNPTVTTIYTVTGSNGACSSTNTISLLVNPNPTVTAVVSPTAICSGATATLTANGASTYTWNPGLVSGNPITVTPTITTTYSVLGTDALGCTGKANVILTVNDPTITATGTPTSVCVVGTVTLNANGASTYTWNPGAATGSSVTVTPTVTTTYTVTGTNTLGCTGSNTLMITVFTNPTVTANTSLSTICSGLSTTLTSNGALTYTWIPGSLTGATVVVSPTTTTTYSVIGVNGVCAADTATITVNVLPSPQNVTATNSGTLTCLTTSVNLFGSTTSTNVAYQWSGPGSYTSATQNPTGITVGGVYTLTVTDIANGCITTATTAIITNTAGPAVTLTSTGTITCLSNTVSISVSSTVAAVTYTWSGPSSFTSTATSFTTSTGGVYTISAFDPMTGCTSTNTVAAITNTYVAVTATIIPATCTGSVTNNNGTIFVGNFINPSDKYDLVTGATYTGSATYATATVIPATGTITSTLANPVANTPYTIRFFGANGCIKDTTLVLIPIDCSVNNALGLAKAITAVTTNTNGTYSVKYKVVVKNTGFASLNNVALTENLSNTFPLPTTFTVSSTPTIITAATSLTLDATFNGSTQPVLTNTVSSVLTVGEVDTILFTVDVLPNGVFGTFNNSVLGAAVGGASSTVVTDSSQVGLNTDPDNDGNPTNNNIPTPLNLTPNQFFGITKEGELSQALSDGSYDITYTVSIHNLGNDTLRNIVLKDSLAGTTIKAPASYSMKSGPTMISGTLTANSSYNGNSDPNLIVSAGSKLAPNTVNKVVFTINVMPDTVTVIRNSAIGSAMGSNSVTVRDTSNNGTNPDINGNGIWNEPSDNVPTVLVIDKFFVPEVFTPNGDGINDFFVIKGIQKTENTLTVYNRWGNKVYKMDNYDNTWSGMPNVSGTLGNQKLPQGTYYYILEFKGETPLKTVNGFVVLQY